MVQPDDDGGGAQHDDEAWMREQLAGLEASHGIRISLTAGADEDGEEWEGSSSLVQLLQASEDGDVAAVEALLQTEEGRGAVNQPGPDGDTPLHLASLFGHCAIVKLLLDQGACASTRNASDGSLPAHDAAASGHLDILQLLVEAAPEAVGWADTDGDTPLHNAARGNHGALVSWLLQKGASAAAVNQEGRMPHEEADEEAVIALLKSASSA